MIFMIDIKIGVGVFKLVYGLSIFMFLFRTPFIPKPRSHWSTTHWTQRSTDRLNTVLCQIILSTPRTAIPLRIITLQEKRDVFKT